jgi:REP element-mobilizing transposase RayT
MFKENAAIHMSSFGVITDAIFFATKATASPTSNGSNITEEHYRCIVYAYVLMSNHVHLLIETGAVRLSKIMQGIQFSYAMHR